MDCPLCQTILRSKKDDEYFICPTCGALVKDQKFYISLEEEKDRYEEHNNDVHDTGYQKFTAPVTQAILENYEPHHIGLDYGCGTGPVISKMLSDQGYQLKLYDPFFYPDKDYLNHAYDYIYSCEVFEHFFRPRQEIEKLLTLLKPGGLLIIMTHLYNPAINFANWYYRNDPTHVFIYTRKTIRFIAAGFPVVIEDLDDRRIIFRKVK